MDPIHNSIEDVYRRSVIAHEAGDANRVLELGIELREMASAQDDQEMVAWSHFLNIMSLVWAERFTAAIRAGTAALSHVDTFGDPLCRINLRYALAFAHLDLLDAPGSLRLATAALDLSRKHVGTVGRVPISRCLNAMAVSMEELGDTTRGVKLLKQAADVLVGETGSGADTARFNAAINLAVLLRHEAERARDEGADDVAIEIANRALVGVDTAEELSNGVEMQARLCAEHRAALGTIAGRPERSLDAVRRIRELAKHEITEPPIVAIYEARALVALGRIDEVCAIDDQQFASFHKPDHDLDFAEWLLTQLIVKEAIGDFEAALALSERLRVHQSENSRKRTEGQVQALIHDAEIQRAHSEAEQLRTNVEQGQIRAHAALQASLRDPLTGIGNRRALDQRLADWADSTLRQPLAVALLDIDHFKSVNDKYGHDVGDSVLCTMSGLLVDCVRSDDVVSRTGGEEFVVLLFACTLDRAIEVANRLHMSVSNHDWSASLGDDRQVTVSVGLTMATDDDDVETVVKRADEAMYRAKRNGRNRVDVDAPNHAARMAAVSQPTSG